MFLPLKSSFVWMWLHLTGEHRLCCGYISHEDTMTQKHPQM